MLAGGWIHVFGWIWDLGVTMAETCTLGQRNQGWGRWTVCEGGSSQAPSVHVTGYGGSCWGITSSLEYLDWICAHGPSLCSSQVRSGLFQPLCNLWVCGLWVAYLLREEVTSLSYGERRSLVFIRCLPFQSLGFIVLDIVTFNSDLLRNLFWEPVNREVLIQFGFVQITGLFSQCL